MVRYSHRLSFAAGTALSLISLCPASAAPNTATPIKHLVVIFQENVSFDHYFATYPKAANIEGEPQFTAAPRRRATSTRSAHAGLLENNPNKTNAANGTDAAAPSGLTGRRRRPVPEPRLHCRASRL